MAKCAGRVKLLMQGWRALLYARASGGSLWKEEVKGRNMGQSLRDLVAVRSNEQTVFPQKACVDNLWWERASKRMSSGTDLREGGNEE